MVTRLSWGHCLQCKCACPSQPLFLCGLNRWVGFFPASVHSPNLLCTPTLFTSNVLEVSKTTIDVSSMYPSLALSHYCPTPPAWRHDDTNRWDTLSALEWPSLHTPWYVPLLGGGCWAGPPLLKINTWLWTDSVCLHRAHIHLDDQLPHSTVCPTSASLTTWCWYALALPFWHWSLPPDAHPTHNRHPHTRITTAAAANHAHAQLMWCLWRSGFLWGFE